MKTEVQHLLPQGQGVSKSIKTLEATILDPGTFEWCLVLLQFVLARQPEILHETNRERHALMTYPLLIDNFWGTKGGGQTPCQEICQGNKVIQHSASPRGDSLLKTDNLARQ
jgi:hypothetical protein